MKPKNIGVLILLLFAVIIGYLFLSGAFEDKNLKRLKDEEIKQLDLSEVSDGVYEGIKYYNDEIFTKVEVTVENHEITHIIVIEDKTSKSAEVTGLIDEIIEKKSLNVDSVSGATISSLLLIFSVQDAVVEVTE